jgi:hypothetical protein
MGKTPEWSYRAAEELISVNISLRIPREGEWVSGVIANGVPG